MFIKTNKRRLIHTARPAKEGLDYFPFDVDIFEDDKLFDLQDEYGPLGEAIFFRLLCFVYKKGYYYKFDSIDKLSRMVIRSIGNRWVADTSEVSEIILYLGECGLFSSEMMQQNVLTSCGIQRRFIKVTGRRQRDISKYWLIEVPEKKEEKSKDEESENTNTVTETADYDCNNADYDSNNSANDCNNAHKVKESKVNKTKAKKTKPNKSKAEQSKAAESADSTSAADDADDAAALAAYCREVDTAYSAVTGKKLSKADIRAVRELYAQNFRVESVTEVIEEVASREKSGRINSFNYFLPAIREMREICEGASPPRGRDGLVYPSSYDSQDIEAILDDEWRNLEVGDDSEYVYD